MLRKKKMSFKCQLFRRRCFFIILAVVFVLNVVLYSLYDNYKSIKSQVDVTVKINRDTNIRNTHYISTPQECMDFGRNEIGMFSPTSIAEPCDNMQIYDNLFANLHNAVLISSKVLNVETGILLEKEKNIETLSHNNLFSGICTVVCSSDFINEAYEDDDYMQQWLKRITFADGPLVSFTTENTLTFIVQRTKNEENIYVMIRNWYNIFLAAYVLDHTNVCDLNVLFADDWPVVNLATAWTKMFGSLKLIKEIYKPTLYKNIVWIIPGSKSMLSNFRLKTVPFIDLFSKLVLQKHNISISVIKNCKALNILLIQSRKSFIFGSKFEREIKNGRQLVLEIEHSFPQHKINVIYLENTSFAEQLTTVSKTNILIGMHGSGMTHVLFLPKDSGVIELFPIDTLTTNNEYKSLARWRELFYISWQNVQSWNDYADESRTYIPPDIILLLLRKIMKKMCS